MLQIKFVKNGETLGFAIGTETADGLTFKHLRTTTGKSINDLVGSSVVNVRNEATLLEGLRKMRLELEESARLQ
jgi:hypothetical protein